MYCKTKTEQGWLYPHQIRASKLAQVENKPLDVLFNEKHGKIALPPDYSPIRWSTRAMSDKELQDEVN